MARITCSPRQDLFVEMFFFWQYLLRGKSLTEQEQTSGSW